VRFRRLRKWSPSSYDYKCSARTFRPPTSPDTCVRHACVCPFLGVPSRRGLGLPPQQLTAPLCLKHSSEQPVHSSCRSAGGSAHGVSLHFARTCNVAANTGGRPRPAALAPTSYRCGSVIPPLALYLLVFGSTPPMVADAMRPTSATTAWFPQVTSLQR